MKLYDLAYIGEEKYSDWEKEDLFSALPAICYFIDVLKKDHPDKRIIFLINCDSIKTEIIECIKNASKRIGIEFVELKNIDKLTKHPGGDGYGANILSADDIFKKPKLTVI